MLKYLNKENLLHFNGTLFNSNNKSYYGYRIDLLKSALQKYMRRRELEKMIWVMVELYLFKFAGEKGYIVLSNVINRIKIFLDEEMCFDDWERYLEVMKLLEEFENNGKEELDKLIKISYILIECNMLRINSDIKGYYKIGVDKYKLDLCLSEGNLEKANLYVKKGDSDNNILIFSKFIDLFERRENDCFYYAIKIFKNEEEGEKGGLRFRRKGCSYIIWEYLINKGKEMDNNKLDKLLNYRLIEYYKKRNERLIFLLSSINLLLNYDDINWNKKLNFDKYNVDVNNMFIKRRKLLIDDYAMDMHCSEGRNRGKNKKDFVLEGALVINEYKKYYNQKWRNVYIKLGIDSVNEKVNNKNVRKKKRKVKSVKVDIEKDLEFVDFNEFSNIKLCTDITCGNKVMCAFALFKGKYVCLKEGRKSMNYNRDYCVVDGLKKYFGLNEIGMYRIRTNKIIAKKDKNIKKWNNNWELLDKDDVVYCVMNIIEEGREIGEYKNDLKNRRDMLYEFIKIGIYRFIFKVTDFNVRNVLVDKNNRLISIDEGSIGKRKDIWGNKNKRYVKMLLDIGGKELIDKMVNELYENMEERKEKIIEMLKKYNFGVKIVEDVISNYDNLRKDVENELNIIV